MERDRIRLSSGALSVSLCRPGAVYGGARFDHAGVMDEICWRGHSFCSVELPAGVEGETTDGVGMISEMRGSEAETFHEGELGSRFAKFGVGSLVNDRPGGYHFMHPYPIAEPCFHRVEAAESRAVILTQQPLCQGYAMTMVKDIRLEGDTLKMTTTLINTGEKDILTYEYNHNFMLIDGLELGEGGYELTLPPMLSLDQVEGDYLTVEGRTLRFTASPEVFFFGLGAAGAPQERWRLLSRRAGVGLRETGGGPIERMSLWGKAHVVSAEAFLKIQAPVGGCVQWQRNWEFFAL